MLGDLIGWVAAQGKNRRRLPRVKRPYRATYTTNDASWQPAIGVDMSTEGMCILTQQPLAQQAFNARATLQTRTVNLRVVPVWQTQVNHNGRAVLSYGLRIVGVAADDWDTIMRWTSDGVSDPESTHMKPDDVARLIPAGLQEKLLQELVRRGRLAPFEANNLPAVLFDIPEVGGSADHRTIKMTLHSRFAPDGKPESLFTTTFAFDENGDGVTVLS